MKHRNNQWWTKDDGMPRNNQKSKVQLAISSFTRTPHPRNVPMIQDEHIQNMILRIAAEDWFTSVFGRVTAVTIIKQKASGNAYRVLSPSARLTGNVIMYVPKWARTPPQILRLLAHALTPEKYAWNGPEYCAIYAYLVKKELGDALAASLVSAFTRHKVDFRPNRHMNSIEGQIFNMKMTDAL